MNNLTVKSTKQEYIDAYKEALNRINELEKIKANPEAVVAKKEKEKVIKQSDAIVEKNILNPEIIEEYNTLKNGIELKKKEIAELSEIQVQVNTLVALVNASKDKEISLADEYKKRKLEEQESFEILKNSLDKQMEELKVQKKDLEESVRKARLRDDEEYKYELSRKKIKDEAEWKDIKAKREKELSEKELAYELNKKELESKQAEFDKMKEEIEGFEVRLNEAKAKGATEKEQQTAKEYGYRKNLYETEYGYKVKGLEDTIEKYKEDNISLKAEKAELQKKLDEAYNKIQGIATETVKSNGGVTLLSNEKKDK